MSPADLTALRIQLVQHEGLRKFAYDDATGNPLRNGEVLKGNLTIGCGRNLSTVGLSELEAMDLLDNDINVSIGILTRRYPWFLTMDAVRQRVLVDLMFNLGPGRFAQFVAMLSDLSENNYGAASREILASAAAKKAPDRYNALAKMMASGVAVL